MERDAKKTKRFEVTLYLNSLKPNDHGILVHSKLGGDHFPFNDWAAFTQKVARAARKIKV